MATVGGSTVRVEELYTPHENHPTGETAVSSVGALISWVEN